MRIPHNANANPTPSLAPGAELRTHTMVAGTLWLTQTPALSLWRGEVGLCDWLRLELRDGRIQEMRLEPTTLTQLRLGRYKAGMMDPPHLQHELFLSSQAAMLFYDGLRWWLRRRNECHEKVLTVVGTKTLRAGDTAPLVHGTFLQIGHARATFVDRRYATPIVPAGAVDPYTGLLGRVGFEHEVASLLALAKQGLLVLLALPPQGASTSYLQTPLPLATTAIALHRHWPRFAIMHEEQALALLIPHSDAEGRAMANQALQLASECGLRDFAVGWWAFQGNVTDAAKELEAALMAAQTAAATCHWNTSLCLRDAPFGARLCTIDELRSANQSSKHWHTVLFGMEDTCVLHRMGAHVLTALEQELAAVVAGRAGPHRGLVTRLMPGVIAASFADTTENLLELFAIEIQREWHARTPLIDGKLELPRTLCWELAPSDPFARATELSEECANPQGSLHALCGGLPYPIAGRMALALAAGSAVERLKLLFDVLEGAWRFVAHIFAAAYFAAPHPSHYEPLRGFEELVRFAHTMQTRHAYPLGKWRELARIVAKGFPDRTDPFGALVQALIQIRHEGNETLEALANQLHPIRNHFAHSVYPEARAQHDLPMFEQMVKDLLRVLRPLCAWTLVTVEKTEPDLYDDTQAVEYIDHTGPSDTGTRRRIRLKSPVRLAHVVYLTRWRDGLFIPLEPFVRRHPRAHGFDLFWIDHLPRPGSCSYSAVVHGNETSLLVEERRLPPRLRTLLDALSLEGV